MKRLNDEQQSLLVGVAVLLLNAAAVFYELLYHRWWLLPVNVAALAVTVRALFYNLDTARIQGRIEGLTEANNIISGKVRADRATL